MDHIAISQERGMSMKDVRELMGRCKQQSHLLLCKLQLKLKKTMKKKPVQQ